MYINLFKFTAILVVFHISTSHGSIASLKSEVQTCVDDNRDEIRNAVTEVIKVYDEKQKQNLYAIKEFRDKINGGLIKRVANEQKLLQQIRDQATRENYNTSACADANFENVTGDYARDSLKVVDAYKLQFEHAMTSAKFLVNQFEANTELLQRRLDGCRDNATCLQSAFDDCQDNEGQSLIVQSESRAHADFERIAREHREQLLALEETNTKRLKRLVKNISNCYRGRKNEDGDDKPSNASFTMTPSFLTAVVAAVCFYFY